MKVRVLFLSVSALLVGPFVGVAQLPPPPPLPSVDVHIVSAPPPPPRREVVVEVRRPAADHVWVSGYWDWHDDDWVWVEGDWVRRPGHSVTWVPARYSREGRRWRYVPAHWSSQRVIVIKEKRIHGKPWRKHHHHHDHDDDDDD